MKNQLIKKIYSLKIKFWLTISLIALKFDNHKLYAFILFLNIQKLKNIKYSNKNIKNILIFQKWRYRRFNSII